MAQTTYSPRSRQRAFLQFLFDGQEGFLCIVTIDRAKPKDDRTRLVQNFYRFPQDLDSALTYIDKSYLRKDVYFCVHLLGEERRQKQDAVAPQALWADVDECPVDELLKTPTMLIESSPDRFQAFWKLDQPMKPLEVEEVNKRMAYHHAPHGMDKGGYDLTQLLRVPYTQNHKYMPPQPVRLVSVETARSYSLKEFKEVYPAIDAKNAGDKIPFPDSLPEMDGESVISIYQAQLNPRAIRFFEEEPEEGKWSEALWQLELSLIESGVPLDEAFLVVRDAACNKFARDGRPESELWTDLVRAHYEVEAKHSPVPVTERPDYSVSPIVKFSPLLSDEERERISKRKTLVEDYIEWATSVTDAASQYHQAGVFIALSTLLAGLVTLPTSFATIRPNLWFMILGDTTLTRKSTAMDMAVDLLVEINPSALLATDGSIEGLLTALSTRPGRPSLFLRDEFTGLLEMIAKRDYFAGMLEMFTKLYDGRYQKRVLRKAQDSIEIERPIFNIFAGGIKDKTFDLLEEKHITSGFVPRFVFVIAETDLTRIKPVGPPTTGGIVERTKMIKKFRKVRDFFANAGVEVDTDEHTITLPKTWEAELTPEAWRRYNVIAQKMEQEAIDSSFEGLLTPCMSRLGVTALKIALLIAATESVGKTELIIEEEDILHAFFYIEQWRENTLQIIEGTSSGPQERRLMSVLNYIRDHPGISRADIFRRFKMNARKGEDSLLTLEQRGLIIKEKRGRGFVYTTVEI